MQSTKSILIRYSSRICSFNFRFIIYGIDGRKNRLISPVDFVKNQNERKLVGAAAAAVVVDVVAMRKKKSNLIFHFIFFCLWNWLEPFQIQMKNRREISINTKNEHKLKMSHVCCVHSAMQCAKCTAHTFKHTHTS